MTLGNHWLWGMTVATLVLNLGTLIWAALLASQSEVKYEYCPKHPMHQYVDQTKNRIVAYPLIVAALLNILGSGFAFHGLGRKNGGSLIWYIVLNSLAMSDQIGSSVGSFLLGESYGYVDSAGYTHSINSTGMKRRYLCYFIVPLIVISLVATVMIGQRREEIRNEMVAQRLSANQPQVIMVPGGTTFTIQQMQPQYQPGQQYQMQYQPGQQYQIQNQQGQQYQQGQMQNSMPQQNQQQGNLPLQFATAPGTNQQYGNLPLQFATAPGTNQQYGTSNPAYAETKPIDT